MKPMNSKYADSFVRCAMLCGSGCKCFTFNERTRSCLSYSLCNALDSTVNEVGWRLYVKQSLSSNGEFEVFAYTISYSILITVLWQCIIINDMLFQLGYAYFLAQNTLYGYCSLTWLNFFFLFESEIIVKPKVHTWAKLFSKNKMLHARKGHHVCLCYPCTD